jgi:biotin carboxyl carrier protein
MELKINIKGKEYIVNVEENGNEIKVIIGNNEYLFNSSTNKEEISFSHNQPNQASSKEIKASIAGIVSQVSVKEGDSIKACQKLLTLSAMKMENEILAEADGKIKKILVKAEDKVKEGDVLIVLE